MNGMGGNDTVQVAVNRRRRRRYGESVSSQPRWPHSRLFISLDSLTREGHGGEPA